ncbi:MAG: FAD-dependent oxidoreductase [bacterium]|nr:FAD-dependent oxidoreductase [bacterium]
MGKRLVLAGAGHAHLTTISAIRSLVKRGHHVTVIGPSSHHYYSGMSPGALAGTYRPQEIRFNVERLTTGRGGHFIRDHVTGIDPESRTVTLSSGGCIPYDVISFNVGSVIPVSSLQLGSGNLFTVKPIERILAGRRAILESGAACTPETPLCTVIVGGGPAGVEMAGGIWRLARDNGVPARVTLVTGGKLLGSFPPRLGDAARSSLNRRGIGVLEGVRAVSAGAGGVSFEDGSTLEADVIFIAAGIIPSPLFTGSLVPTAEDGGLLVNHYLQSVGYPEIFGGGDCVTIRGENLARVGVYAVRQNPVLLHNIAAALDDQPMVRFNPGSPSFLLLLNMGDGTAIYRKGRWVWQGKLAFKLKDFIDRRFMRKFQLSGELAEPQ